MATTPQQQAANDKAYKDYLKNLYKRKQEDAALAKEGADYATRQQISNEKGGISSGSSGGSSRTEEQFRNTQFIDKATAAGYNKADIVNAVTQGKQLTPSQSSQVQDFVSKAKAQGYTNADIVNAVTQGTDLQRKTEFGATPLPTGEQSKEISRIKPNSDTTRGSGASLQPRLKDFQGSTAEPNFISKVGAEIGKTISSPFIGAVKAVNVAYEFGKELGKRGEGNTLGSRVVSTIGTASAKTLPQAAKDANIQSTGIALGILSLPVSTVPVLVGTALTYSTAQAFNTDIPLEKRTADLVLAGIGASPLATKSIRNIYIKTGSKYVEPSEIFGAEVLAGNAKLVKTTSIDNSITSFKATQNKAGNYEVSTASPQPISGKIVGVGKKAGMGKEDAGIYVTPKGKASPYFLRQTGIDSITYKPTINPLKGATNIPTVTTFAVKDIVRYPREIITTKGFSAVSKYAEEVLAPQAKAVITKRSEIGQGTIPSQYFIIPKGRLNEFTGKLSPKTTLAKERGTTELEAIVPKGTAFFYKSNTLLGKIKGFDSFTTYEGSAIALRNAAIIERKYNPQLFDSFISSRKIAKESSYLSETANTNKYYSPIVRIYNPYVAYYKKLSLKSTNLSENSNNSIKNNTVTSLGTYQINKIPKNSIPTSILTSQANSYKAQPYNQKNQYRANRSEISNPSIVNTPSVVKLTPSTIKPYPSSPKPNTPRPYSNRYPEDETQRVPFLGKIGLKSDDDKSKKKRLFNVFVKRKGEYVKITKQPLTEAEARSFAAFNLRNTAAATAKLTKVFSESQGSFTIKESLAGFIQKAQNVFIQPRNQRIGTQGEKEQITYKGIAAQRVFNRGKK